MQLSLTAVSYAIWALCEVGEKQSALIRRVNKVESIVLQLWVVLFAPFGPFITVVYARSRIDYSRCLFGVCTRSPRTSLLGDLISRLKD